jgi:SAM-dependent methyltransferase
MKYMDFDTFQAKVSANDKWRSYRDRWIYHEKAIALIDKLNISRAKAVLEIGTFGAALVTGSDTMDCHNDHWIMDGYAPKIWHDARILPWPFKDKKYDLVVALRVFHHLAPVQQECFAEARRIARNVLLVCPEKEIVGIGIKREQFRQWNGGNPADYEEDLSGGWGRVYLWKEIA